MLDQKIKDEITRGTQISIINLVDYLIEKASDLRASDIHIDPSNTKVRVRLRVDGVLQDAYEFPKNIHPEIISRIKVLARLRTDEHQATQDGRFRHILPDGSFIDIRVSIAPTYHGENSVMRLLSNNAETFTLEAMGFSESDRKKIEYALKKPSGM